MSVLEALAIFVAGIGAGTINVVVGSGTLITFPVLLAVGYNPITANVSNSLGLVPGSVAGAWGYRRELRGQRKRILRYGFTSFTGAIVGALLLLELPASAFEAIVPIMVAIALVLVVLQPQISRWLVHHRRADASPDGGPLTAVLGFGTGVYGGYFGAAQGILVLALFGISLDDDLQRLNALKNVLTALVNLVSGIVFVFIADVAWEVVALLAVGSVTGGVIGARIGRRLSPVVLRATIVVVGVTAIVQLLR